MSNSKRCQHKIFGENPMVTLAREAQVRASLWRANQRAENQARLREATRED